LLAQVCDFGQIQLSWCAQLQFSRSLVEVKHEYLGFAAA
jgi:hypothetical protein